MYSRFAQGALGGLYYSLAVPRNETKGTPLEQPMYWTRGVLLLMRAAATDVNVGFAAKATLGDVI